MASVQIRLNDEEEEWVLRAMIASGDKQTATHIKKVYFEAIKGNDLMANKVYEALELLNHKLDNMGKSEPGEVVNNDQQMMLALLCGLYVMIRKSVSENIRKSADVYLDAEAIESYLKEEK
jgi:hypothetical protein